MGFKRTNAVEGSAMFELAGQLMQNEGIAAAAVDFYRHSICQDASKLSHKPTLIFYAGEVLFGEEQARGRIEHDDYDILLSEAAVSQPSEV